jgi:divalent metal cation (Fe/Co/Zn/Cd) transporter
VCIDYDARIQFIDTVLVYHFGSQFLVEVHIVLDENMRLKETHDISEALQVFAL